MARKKKRAEIGVYVFAGFLEGGKTSYIRSLLSGPDVPKDMRPLVLQTEEGSKLEWKVGLPWANTRGSLNSPS